MEQQHSFEARTSIGWIDPQSSAPVVLRGWIYRLRVLASTTFVILRDSTGEVQCVADSAILAPLHLKLDTVEIVGPARVDARAKRGFEIDIEHVRVLNPATNKLPFNS